MTESAHPDRPSDSVVSAATPYFESPFPPAVTCLACGSHDGTVTITKNDDGSRTYVGHCNACGAHEEESAHPDRPSDSVVSAAPEACPCGCRRTVKPCPTQVAHDDHCWPLVGGVMSLYWCPGVSRRKAVHAE